MSALTVFVPARLFMPNTLKPYIDQHKVTAFVAGECCHDTACPKDPIEREEVHHKVR